MCDHTYEPTSMYVPGNVFILEDVSLYCSYSSTVSYCPVILALMYFIRFDNHLQIRSGIPHHKLNFEAEGFGRTVT